MTSTNLCLNMRAGSMLAEVRRTTCLISLAIILSFSKFTRPSTLESLPVRRRRSTERMCTRTRTEHVQSQPSNCFKGEKRFMFEAECEMSTLTLSSCLSSASQLWLDSFKELPQFSENFFFCFFFFIADTAEGLRRSSHFKLST